MGGAAEREADAAARQVLLTSAPAAVRRRPAEDDDDGRERIPATAVPTLSGGRPLDGETRGWFEPRFGHDFGRVRVHLDAPAAASARALRAHAYTIGSDIVFAPGRYAPGTAAGRHLLAHELTHVVQGGGMADAPIVRRLPDTFLPNLDEAERFRFEVYEYQIFLEQNLDIEGMPTSRMKAMVLAKKRLRGEEVQLPENGDALLVLELVYIPPGPEHRAAALGLLKAMNPNVLAGMLMRGPGEAPGRINVWELAARFGGADAPAVIDVLSRRLKGGFMELLRGTRPIEAATASELEAQAVEWVAAKPKTAEEYFADVWSRHRVVSLGERHKTGPRQLEFTAQMIRSHLGPGDALALELKEQRPVDAYMKGGDDTLLPKWFLEHKYDQLLQAAAAKKVDVVAADVAIPSGAPPPKSSLDPERDVNMAAMLGVQHGMGKKVLFYGGSYHVRELVAHHETPMGRHLALAHGADAYSIVLRFEDTHDDPLFAKLYDRFPSMKSIGFDVDESPLRWRTDPDFKGKASMGENLDGFIYLLR